MRPLSFFILSCTIAAAVPFLPFGRDGIQALQTAPVWPTELDGRPLKALPLSTREQEFAKDFPGHMSRWTDGTREVIVRWVTRGTRKLHPSSDCFQAIGYSIKPLPVKMDSQGRRWAEFQATKGSQELRVYERIYDLQGRGWTDVSAWYWATVLGKTKGPWFAMTIAETQRGPS